jgi:hypothetical protein
MVGGAMREVEGRIGLAEFLTDLRAELGEAQRGAADDSLKLGVEEITLTLDVAYTLTREAKASAGVRAKFWVLASAGGDVKGSVSSERGRTQQLTLTLKPRLEQTVTTHHGRQMTIQRGVDVEGTFAKGEELPPVAQSAES